MSGPTDDKEIYDLVNNIFKNTYDEFKKGDKMNLRSSSKESFEENWSNMQPLLTASVSAIMIAMDKRNQKKDAELIEFKEHCQDKIIKQHILTDKLDTYNRQDNLLLIGFKEPPKNYEDFGRESEEELENILISIGEKVGVEIKSEHISVAYRIGNNHKHPNNTPKKTSSGDNVARPILYKFSKKAKRAELFKNKKDLRTDHNTKIAEDTTPLRRALCEVTNKLDHVKVAYPQDGKICVRLHSNPKKVIRMESHLDLESIGYSGEFNWKELKLDDLIL